MAERRGFSLPVLAAAVAIFALSGCSETATLQGGGLSQGQAASGAGASANATVFPDIPIPDNAKMVVDKTLVVGTENWFGQLALEASSGPVAIFDFYRTRLPQFGWQEITSVRAPVSVLTFDRGDRILQMQISSTTLRGSSILITVSPRGTPNNTSGAPSSSGLSPAPVTRIN